jgi:hypothetical protein
VAAWHSRRERRAVVIVGVVAVWRGPASRWVLRGGRAAGEAGGELGVGAAAAGAAELPQCCGGPVVAVDGLIHGMGIDLPARCRCPEVAEQSGELRLVVGADPFVRGAPVGLGAHDATVPRCGQAGRGPGSPAVLMREVGRRCQGRWPALRSNPARRA